MWVVNGIYKHADTHHIGKGVCTERGMGGSSHTHNTETGRKHNAVIPTLFLRFIVGRGREGDDGIREAEERVRN